MKKSLLILSILLVSLSSCSDWFDINESPNSVSKENVTMELMLPGLQYNIVEYQANSTYGHMLAQHLTKSGVVSGSYPVITGSFMPQNMDSWWSMYYSSNSDILQMYSKAVLADDKAFMAISQVLFVMNTHRLVDIFGDAPYSESWKPNEIDAPAYDDGKTIYADLLVKLDEATTNLKAAISAGYQTAKLSTVDIFCYGDLAQWVRFTNSLKLRLLMRESDVMDVKAQIAAIANDCIAADEDILVNPGFYVESGKMNIFYEDFGWNKQGNQVNSRKYYLPTATVVDMLRDNNDPRLRVFIDPRPELGNPNDGSADYELFGLGNERYIGVPFGQLNPPDLDYTCKIGTGVLAGGSDLEAGKTKGSILMTGAETSFLLAEAALKGYIVGGDSKAKELYTAAVKASFDRHSEALISDKFLDNDIMLPEITTTAIEAADSYLAQDSKFMNWNKMTSNSEKLAAIAAQKWLNFYAYNSVEAWSEYRRLGAPALKGSNSTPETKIMSRMLYPQSEMNENTVKYEEHIAKIGEIDVFESLVFWDKENGNVEKAEVYE